MRKIPHTFLDLCLNEATPALDSPDIYSLLDTANMNSKEKY